MFRRMCVISSALLALASSLAPAAEVPLAFAFTDAQLQWGPAPTSSRRCE